MIQHIPFVSNSTCTQQLYSMETTLNNVFCANGCPNTGLALATCSQQCAALWIPFSKGCSEYLRSDPQLAPLINITSACELTTYGKFTDSYFGGRCSIIEYNKRSDDVTTTCCGPNNMYCTGSSNTAPKLMTSGTCSKGYRHVYTAQSCAATAKQLGLRDTVPQVVKLSRNPRGCYYNKQTNQLYLNQAGSVRDADTTRISVCAADGANAGIGGAGTGVNDLPSTCSTACSLKYEDFYAECNPRLKETGVLDKYTSFLQKCQGVFETAN